MRQLLLSILVLVLGSSWVAAQNSQPTPSGGSGEITVQGCLSGFEGNYLLKDTSGTSYQLSGETANLKEHVGHEIKVTGTMGAASVPASGGTVGQANDSSKETLQVSSVKHISKTCQSGGMSH